MKSRRKVRFLILIFLIFIPLIFYSCRAVYNTGAVDNTIRNTGRELLVDDESEGFYGMYTYMLFTAPPNENTRERYLAAIDRFLSFQPIEEYASYISPDSLNVIYLPINEAPLNETNSDSLLAIFNYTRANVILSTVPDSIGINFERGGPYLVSSLEPLTNLSAISNPYIVQDLSTIPPHIVELWIDEFLIESQVERSWDEKAMREIVLNIRTNIARAAEGWPNVEAAVVQFVKIFF